jgi:hypothetical protein
MVNSGMLPTLTVHSTLQNFHINLFSSKDYTFEMSGSHGGEHENYSLLDIASCSLLEADRRFRGSYCLHHQGDES